MVPSLLGMVPRALSGQGQRSDSCLLGSWPLHCLHHSSVPSFSGQAEPKTEPAVGVVMPSSQTDLLVPGSTGWKGRAFSAPSLVCSSGPWGPQDHRDGDNTRDGLAPSTGWRTQHKKM